MQPGAVRHCATYGRTAVGAGKGPGVHSVLQLSHVVAAKNSKRKVNKHTKKNPDSSWQNVPSKQRPTLLLLRLLAQMTMARRGEEYARLNPGGGYTQALTVGKGFSGTDRSSAKHSGSKNVGGRGGGSSGTMSAFARHQELIRNYHRYLLWEIFKMFGVLPHNLTYLA